MAAANEIETWEWCQWWSVLFEIEPITKRIYVYHFFHTVLRLICIKIEHLTENFKTFQFITFIHWKICSLSSSTSRLPSYSHSQNAAAQYFAAADAPDAPSRFWGICDHSCSVGARNTSRARSMSIVFWKFVYDCKFCFDIYRRYHKLSDTDTEEWHTARTAR